MYWQWALGASSLGWALFALLRHFSNLSLLRYVFRQELRQPGGNVRSAVKAMKEAAEALRLARGDTPERHVHLAGKALRSLRPNNPPGDPPPEHDEP